MKPIKKISSLKVKLLGAVGLEVLVFLAIAIALQIQQTGEIIRNQVDIYGNSMAVALADFSIEELLSLNYPSLQSSVRYVGEQDEQILGIEIRHHGRSVAEYISQEIDEEEVSFEDPESWEACCANAFKADAIFDPIDQDPRHLGEVRFYLSDAAYEEFLATQIRLIWILGIVLLVGDIIASFWIIKLLVLNPMRKVADGASELSKGNLDYKIEIANKDEIGMLAGTLNKLASDLKVNQKKAKDKNIELEKSKKDLEEAKSALEVKVKERTKELEKEKAKVEEKIQERTKELQERVGELERFHKLTIGREKRMIELKKENEELKKELGKPSEKTEDEEMQENEE